MFLRYKVNQCKNTKETQICDHCESDQSLLSLCRDLHVVHAGLKTRVSKLRVVCNKFLSSKQKHA